MASLKSWDEALIKLRDLASHQAPPPQVVVELKKLLESNGNSRAAPGLKRTRSDYGMPPRPLGRTGSLDDAMMGARRAGKAPENAKRLKLDLSARKLNLAGRRLAAKHATVRIGLYDRLKERFFDLGSGAIISSQGRILTAAHLFVGPKPDPDLVKQGLLHLQNPPPFSQMYSDGSTERFRSRGEARDLVICIGKFVDDKKPCEWAYTATLVTPKEVLMKFHEISSSQPLLLDLAVLQITGSLTMSPSTFKPKSQPSSEAFQTYLASDPSMKFKIIEEAAFHPDQECELPAVLKLGDPSAVPVGENRLLAVGWPSHRGEYTLHMDKDARTQISAKMHGYVKSKLFVHSASSGGPCIDIETGHIIGVTSYDNSQHDNKDREYASYFRKGRCHNPIAVTGCHPHTMLHGPNR